MAIENNFEAFSKQFGIKIDDSEAETTDKSKLDTDAEIERLTEQYLDAVRNEKNSLDPEIVVETYSSFSDEVEKAYHTLNVLKGMAKPQNPLQSITLKDIEENEALRKSLIDQHDGRHILNNQSVVEIEKNYTNYAPGELDSFEMRRDAL